MLIIILHDNFSNTQLLYFSWRKLQHYSDFTSPYCSFCSWVHIILNSDYIRIDKKSSTLEGVALKGNIPAIRLYLAANGPDVNISDNRDTNASTSSGDLDTWLLATRQGASISTGPKEKLKDALASLNFLVAEESLQTFNEVTQHLPFPMTDFVYVESVLTFHLMINIPPHHWSILLLKSAHRSTCFNILHWIGEKGDSHWLLNNGSKTPAIWPGEKLRSLLTVLMFTVESAKLFSPIDYAHFCSILRHCLNSLLYHRSRCH